MKNKQKKPKRNKQKKQKGKAVKMTCPCCKEQRRISQLSQMIQLARKLEERTHQFYRSTAAELFVSFGSYFNDWACDFCLEDGQAIIANPLKQNYCWHPHYAYRDIGKVCERCDQHFLFSKSEQKFWYEELQFWHKVIPKHCLSCRKEIRAGKALNTRLSNLLEPGVEKLELADLEEVNQIYLEMGKEEKAKFIQAMIRKRKRLL